MPTPYDHEHEQDEIIYFGLTNFRNQRRKFGIKTDDRRRHMYLLGKTGMGKTTLLENMIVADIRAGHGVAYVDPHGDTAEKILDFIPPHRINDVIYFNPSDMEFPIGFNPLESVDEEHKHLVASGLMGVFKKIWPDVWSARMEYILNNSILALLDYPGSTLLGINRLLADKIYRKRVISKIKDPLVKSFWANEFARYTEKFAQEAIAPLQNKVGQFLSSVLIRNIVAQVQSRINIREIMDERKILIMNLAKGKIGEDNSRLLGGMLITKLQMAAMERVDIPNEKDRQDFYLYVDEFQNFATESFANILSEARKYRLNLIIAHQYIEQLDEKVCAAVFGNVGTIVTFRIGAMDAEMIAKEFAPHFTEEDVVNLAKFEIYLKLMIDGVASSPFSAATMPPIFESYGVHDKVVKVSRERYAEPRAHIEEKVARWTGLEGNDEDDMDTTEAKSSTPRVQVAPSVTGAPHAPPPRIRLAEEVRKPESVTNSQKQQPAPSPNPQSTTPQPQSVKPAQIKISDTVPSAKSETEGKGISLSDALKQKPMVIKGNAPSHPPRQQGSGNRPPHRQNNNGPRPPQVNRPTFVKSFDDKPPRFAENRPSFAKASDGKPQQPRPQPPAPPKPPEPVVPPPVVPTAPPVEAKPIE